MTDKSYADEPQSITELRSDKTQNAADWTPRDALISVLRGIDSGEIETDALVVCFRTKHAERGHTSTHYRSAGPDPHVTYGLMMNAMHKMQTEGAQDKK